jgi:hypothetical protein
MATFTSDKDSINKARKIFTNPLRCHSKKGAYMFKALACLLLLNFSLLFAENIVLPKNHVLVTEQGIFVEINNNLMQAESVSYVGNGMYEVTNYGYCGRCGWPIGERGCTNQNCDGYGPRRD